MALLWLLFCFTLIGTSPAKLSHPRLLLRILTQQTSPAYIKDHGDQDGAPCLSTSLAGSGAPASDPDLNIVPRITSGTHMLPGSLPWLVDVMTVNRIQFCWGALVNKSWVITAAHCNVTTFDWVVARLYDPSSGRKDIQILKIAQVFLHPQLNLSATDNDIALLKLARPAHLSTPVYPASLPTPSDRFRPGHLCLTLGFMFTHPYASKHAEELQEALVTVVRNTTCRKHWGRINTDANICSKASFLSCWEVDSGAPLVCRKKNTWTLVGVMSFMSQNCPTLKPLVFTRVTKIVPWIQETMANN